MIEVFIGLVVVLSILVFALIGFVNFLAWVFKSGKGARPEPEQPKPSLSADVLASSRLIDHLRSTKEINDRAYRELRGFLIRKFPQQLGESSKPHQLGTRPHPTNPDVSFVPPVAESPKNVTPTIESSEPIKQTKAGDATTQVESNEEFAVAELVEIHDAHAVPKRTEPSQSKTPFAEPAADTAVVSKPAPWDIPDPPAPPPRRTFGELMSGFMQEKNMRWGELTSGILIVLSAVGLVVSLQKELSIIPYFSALLFMLITAGIHGAGIYTLRRWKLRSTSRGTLVIGLLLIPLNFVAACFLSDQRALSDPMLWVAIVIGVVAFSTMTWWSSKFLLRRGNLPMALAIMGCGMGTLLLNRTVENAGNSFMYWILALPVMASFLIGTCTFDTRQWVRRHWSERASNRMFLCLGLSVFASIAALSLIVVRAESKSVGLVSIAPIVSMICLVTSWLGSIVYRGSMSRREEALDVMGHAHESDRDHSSDTTPGIRISCLTLKILGLILLAVSLIASASNPSVFIANAILSALGMIVMFIHQEEEQLLPIAWGVLALGSLAALNLATGVFQFDEFTSWGQLKTALVNGKSGLCLLAVGLVIGGANRAMTRWIPNLKNPRMFVTRGWITGGVVILAGCAIALVASLLHRENTFDVMVASGLLILAAIGLLAVSVIAERKGFQKAKDVPHYASILLMGALAHLLLWNPVVANWIDSWTAINVRWVAMFAIHGVVLIGLGWCLNRGRQSQTSGSTSGMLMAWGSGSNMVLCLGALTLAPAQTGWATFFELIACLCWFFVGKAWHRDADLKQFAAAPFVLTTGLFVSVTIAELISRTTWCPGVDTPQHWLVQLVGLSGWTIIWTCMTDIVRRSPWGNWLETMWLDGSKLKVDQIVMFFLVLVIGGFVGDSLMAGTARELVQQPTLTGVFELGEFSPWMTAALVAVGAALLVSLIVMPTVSKGAAFILVWFLAWAFGAEPFNESRSVGSAIRWLLPIGGVIGAVLIAARRTMLPAWSGLRNGLGFVGKSYWHKTSTQQLINLSLTVVSGIVLLISTLTGAQFILHGASSLGGPTADSWFRLIPAEVSFGAPIGMIVATFLLYAVTEKRSWLATIGSVVFQYFVALAIVLLFLSPHESLASRRFVHILQAVSLGMTVYGFAWFWMRDRIEGRSESRAGLMEGGAGEDRKVWLTQIEAHTLLNGLLITSLAVLAMGRFFLVPDQPGAWISSVGSLMGVVAWAAFGVLAFCIWRNNATKGYSAETWVWLVGWMGLILVGLSSAVVDHNYRLPEDFVAWLPFRVVMIGAVLVGWVQAGLIWWLDRASQKSSNGLPLDSDNSGLHSESNQSLALPVLLTGAIALTFAVRGAWLNPSWFWLFIGVIVLMTIFTTCLGWVLRDGKLSFVSAATSVIGSSIVFWKDPHGWFSSDHPDWFNLIAIVLSLLALCWTVFAIFPRKSEPVPKSFSWMPNIVLLGGVIWIFASAILQYGMDNWARSAGSWLANPLGITAYVAVFSLAISTIWNDRAKFRVVSGCLLSVSLAISLASALSASNEGRFVGVLLGVGLMVAGWGIVWINRASLFRIAKRLGATRLESLEFSMQRQLPIYSLVFGGLVLIAALGVIFQFEFRPHRYMAASIPFAVAIGLGCQSNQVSRRWLQVLTLLLLTCGVLFLAWADLSRAQMTELPMIRLLVRSLIVLAGAMFVYGAMVSRWVRAGDTWLKSLREMAVVTCGLAVVCLVLVIASEASSFKEGVGCGLMLGESVTVAILVAGMIAGLIIIALRPENDPFALTLAGRMGYVYAAEFVGLALIAHLYFSLPWLFQLGIKDYWPYIMMALCFGGVGVANVLEKRNLTVLGQPLFNSAAALPLIVALAVFGVNSEANLELVMLTVGLAYLMISYTHKSLLSGAAAIVFGNLALWMTFSRVDGFSFFDHPQLWLIPPALSTLIASQISRKILPPNQLSGLRYICIAVIYVSSTVEAFWDIGENLFPPIVLATLSVAGIMCGIMFRVKSFLYFGSLFLLMAMITMVAHAHQSLGHVWPWWAFGIGLGIAILVMFGLFEKKKNEMKAIAGSLKEWES